MLDASFIYIPSIPISIILLIIWLKQKKKPSSILFYILFYFYIIAVMSVTLFPLPFDKLTIENGREMTRLDTNNFIPFTFIDESIATLTPDPRSSFPYYYSVLIVLKQVGKNILLGIPFGFLVPLIWKKRNTIWRVLIAGFWFSFGIEATQFLISRILGYNYRLTDIDDIILNCTGVALGYLGFKISLLFLKWLKLMIKKEKQFQTPTKTEDLVGAGQKTFKKLGGGEKYLQNERNSWEHKKNI